MLSLTASSGATKIASFEQHKGDNKTEKFIYIKDDSKTKLAEIETNKPKKLEIFKSFLERDKKMRFNDIELLTKAYASDLSVPARLERKYDDAQRYVQESLKHYLDYPDNVKLNPLVEQPTYRMFVSGLSGSGKSTYIGIFLKHNKPKFIFLMSPVRDDKAYKHLKPTPVHIDLNSYSQEFEKEFEIEDFPPDSVVILDDTDTAKDAKMYAMAKIALLERGRHLSVSTIVVSHNPLGGNNKASVTQLLEAEYYVIFPKHNKSHAEKLLKRYVGLGQLKSDLVLDTDSRAVLVKKSYPSYFIGDHTVGTLN